MVPFNGANCLDWVLEVERYFFCYSVSDSLKLLLASSFIEGEAREWFYPRYHNNGFRDWDHFVDEMFIRFRNRTNCLDVAVAQRKTKEVTIAPDLLEEHFNNIDTPEALTTLLENPIGTSSASTHFTPSVVSLSCSGSLDNLLESRYEMEKFSKCSVCKVFDEITSSEIVKEVEILMSNDYASKYELREQVDKTTDDAYRPTLFRFINDLVEFIYRLPIIDFPFDPGSHFLRSYWKNGNEKLVVVEVIQLVVETPSDTVELPVMFLKMKNCVNMFIVTSGGIVMDIFVWDPGSSFEIMNLNNLIETVEAQLLKGFTGKFTLPEDSNFITKVWVPKRPCHVHIYILGFDSAIVKVYLPPMLALHLSEYYLEVRNNLESFGLQLATSFIADGFDAYVDLPLVQMQHLEKLILLVIKSLVGLIYGLVNSVLQHLGRSYSKKKLMALKKAVCVTFMFSSIDTPSTPQEDWVGNLSKISMRFVQTLVGIFETHLVVCLVEILSTFSHVKVAVNSLLDIATVKWLLINSIHFWYNIWILNALLTFHEWIGKTLATFHRDLSVLVSNWIWLNEHVDTPGYNVCTKYGCMEQLLVWIFSPTNGNRGGAKKLLQFGMLKHTYSLLEATCFVTYLSFLFLPFDPGIHNISIIYGIARLKKIVCQGLKYLQVQDIHTGEGICTFA